MAQENIDRKIESSFNGTSLSGNVAIQSDNVVQTQNIGTNENMSNAFQELEKLIHSLNPDITREQAESNTEQLKAAIDAKDKTKSEKMLKFLIGTLGVVQPLITIAQIAGIPIPNIPTP